jgi:hypothetical protein
VNVSTTPPIVYISHSAHDDVEPIRDFLASEGFIVRDSYDLSAPEDAGEAIRFGIGQADFVIAVVGDQNPNVFFELGVAAAFQKRILLLTKPGATAPIVVRYAPYVSSDLADSPVLRLALKRFLTPDSHEASPRQDRTEPSDAPELQRILNEIADLRGKAGPQQVERLAANLLRAANVTALEESNQGEDRGVDFVVWSESVQASVGNPLLIEIKSGNIGGVTFRDAYNRLHSQVLRVGAGAGLLLYLEAGNRRFSQKELPSSTTVIAFDLEDLARELLQKTFAKVIIERRNRLAHGLA